MRPPIDVDVDIPASEGCMHADWALACAAPLDGLGVVAGAPSAEARKLGALRALAAHVIYDWPTASRTKSTKLNPKSQLSPSSRQIDLGAFVCL